MQKKPKPEDEFRQLLEEEISKRNILIFQALYDSRLKKEPGPEIDFYIEIWSLKNQKVQDQIFDGTMFQSTLRIELPEQLKQNNQIYKKEENQLNQNEPSWQLQEKQQKAWLKKKCAVKKSIIKKPKPYVNSSYLNNLKDKKTEIERKIKDDVFQKFNSLIQFDLLFKEIDFILEGRKQGEFIIKLLGVYYQPNKDSSFTNVKFDFYFVFEEILMDLREYIYPTPKKLSISSKLQTQVKPDAKHTLKEKIKILISLCEHLDFFHSYDSLHLDLSPENIYLNHSLETLLSGFKYARKVNDDNQLIDEQFENLNYLGNQQYRAPELSQKTYSTKSDIWSFGLICYEVVLEKPPKVIDQTNQNFSPFDDNWDQELIQQCPELIKLINGCTKENPDDRFNSTQAKAILRKLFWAF